MFLLKLLVVFLGKLLNTGQLWFKKTLGGVHQQTIIWTIYNEGLGCHMAFGDHTELGD